jgi:hypothetical protein
MVGHESLNSILLPKFYAFISAQPAFHSVGTSIRAYEPHDLHLAYIELCDVTAAIVKAFDMSFGPKYNVSSCETSVRDLGTSARAYLPVIPKERK